METTGDKVLKALAAHDLKPEKEGRYRCNSPLRTGSNSHGFMVWIHPDGEHGGWHDHARDERGSLYDLAEKLGIAPTHLQQQPTPSSKRGYAGMDDYAAA